MGLFASADAFHVVDAIDEQEALSRLLSRLEVGYAVERNPNNVVVHADFPLELRISRALSGLTRIGIFLDETLPRKARNEQVWKVFSPIVDSGLISAIRFSRPAFFATILYGAEMHLYGQRDLVEWLARNGSAHSLIFQRDPLSDLSIISLTIRGANALLKTEATTSRKSPTP